MSLEAIGVLRASRVVVSPDMFAVVGLRHGDWLKLLEDPELSPRMSAPFLIFYDGLEVTMLLDENDLGRMRSGLDAAKIEPGFRLLTFDTEMDFSVVGFIAEVSRILAEAEISIVALSAFSRDHLLIKQSDLGNALKALGPYVAELC